MKEILLLNPAKRRRKRSTTKKRATKKRATKRSAATRKSAARKTTRKTAVRRLSARKGSRTMAKKRTTKRRIRRNPTSRTTRARRAVTRRASSSIAGLNFKGALKNVPLTTLGMFASKFAAKRFGEAATETDPSTWNYASYLKGAAGAAIAGFLANMVKRGTGQKVLEGGLSLMAYKLVQNELIAGNTFWSGQLGAANAMMPGTIQENDEGTPYILGDDGGWIPLEGDDLNRAYVADYSGALVEPGPLGLGDALLPPGPLGQTNMLDQSYVSAFNRR